MICILLLKQAFDDLKEAYLAVELENRDDGDAIQDALNVKTGSRSVSYISTMVL